MSIRPYIKMRPLTPLSAVLRLVSLIGMYELIILSLLMRGPLHGYLIAKIVNDMIGPLAKVSNGTLYPLLTKLEQAGLIAMEDGNGQQPGKRQLRTFAITESGRKRFHQLIMDTTSNPGEYQRFF